MEKYYIIRLGADKWLSSILNIGLNSTQSRSEALKIKDLDVALSILKLAASSHAIVEEVNVTVTIVKE